MRLEIGVTDWVPVISLYKHTEKTRNNHKKSITFVENFYLNDIFTKYHKDISSDIINILD